SNTRRRTHEDRTGQLHHRSSACCANAWHAHDGDYRLRDEKVWHFPLWNRLAYVSRARNGNSQGTTVLDRSTGTAVSGAQRKLTFEIGGFRFCPAADPRLARNNGQHRGCERSFAGRFPAGEGRAETGIRPISTDRLDGSHVIESQYSLSDFMALR